MATGKKYYAVFIVSNAPLDLEHLPEDPNIRHLVSEEFEKGVDLMAYGHAWVISKAAPAHCRGSSIKLGGRGDTISVTIADWLKTLCGHTFYVPFFRRRS